MALQRRPETAQSLADKLEVSKRTILRDMQSLSEMGIPLFSMTGPSGGFQLMEGFQLSPLQFNSQEALIILLALQAITRISDTPFNKERWTVIDKIINNLPANMLKQLEPILEHTEVNVPKRSYKAPHLSALLSYTANGFWYCEAYSTTHQEDRLFRVDRLDTIKEVEPPLKELQLIQSEIDKNESYAAANPIRIKAKLTIKVCCKLNKMNILGN